MIQKKKKKSQRAQHPTFRIVVHPGGGRRMNSGRDTGDFRDVDHVLLINVGVNKKIFFSFYCYSLVHT